MEVDFDAPIIIDAVTAPDSDATNIAASTAAYTTANEDTNVEDGNS